MQPLRRLLLVGVLLALVGSARAVDEPVSDSANVAEAVGSVAEAELPPPPPPNETGDASAEAAAASSLPPPPPPNEAGDASAEAAAAGAEEAAAAAPVDPPPPPAGPASVQWVVTQKMRMQLSKLGYSQEEIGKLDPERAAAIIRRGITRPARGVPGGWSKGMQQQGSKGIRSAVGLGQSLLAKTKGVPGGPIAPAVALALGALTLVLKRGGGGPNVLVKRAVGPSVTEPLLEKSNTSDELWLDRQIDRLIAFLKDILGK
ncbi:hypothetical protein Ctob_003193 [Chrysochromulina tobinii]|uniref:Uncharacterized protein n=1 Tax=Chrysochromulina tobinii TaxID=1460289 RepID=A0A0M0JP82_9EUKA|nr:hypothetical protein Ctob_003193 [Chrysochromulina tobinii]|eukprot:KOO28416.1 hypothetical protein Ctob_003193 [Chrysochromulina sp. CCMP291]